MTNDEAISFPRQEAATRRFRLGLPRAFAPAPDGQPRGLHPQRRRSRPGRQPVGRRGRWRGRPDGAARIVDARELVRADADLPRGEGPARADAGDHRRHHRLLRGRRCDARRLQPRRHPLHRRPGYAQPTHGARSCRIPVRSSIRASPRTAPPSPSSATGRCTSCATDAASEARVLAERWRRHCSPGGWPTSSPPRSSTACAGLWWLAGSTAVLAEHVDESPGGDPLDRGPGPARAGAAPAPLPGRRHGEPASPGSSASAIDGARDRDRVGPRGLPLPGHGPAGRRRRRRDQRAQPRPATAAHPRT